jgi:hypothetical protein
MLESCCRVSALFAEVGRNLVESLQRPEFLYEVLPVIARRIVFQMTGVL